ncbi:MAG: hypothetical protein ACOVP5_06095 [Chitinophagales bacterium]
MFSNFILNGQNEERSEPLQYKCGKLGSKAIQIKVTPTVNKLEYEKKTVKTFNLDFLSNSTNIGSFKIYPYQKKIYITNGADPKINWRKDQVIIDNQTKNYISLKLNGVMQDVTLNYLGSLLINDTEFFNYSVTNNFSSDVKLVNIRLDNKLRIDEWTFKSGKDKCSCTKENIRIRLR